MQCKMLSTFLLLIMTTGSFAAPVLDQEYDEGIAGTASSFLAQTFTVGLGGILSRVEIAVSPIENATFALLETMAGVPAPFDTALITVALPDLEFDPFNFISINLSSFDVAVDVGDVLALAVGGGNVQWTAGVNDFVPTYAGGTAFGSGDGTNWREISAFGGADLHFRTFVGVPEPTALVSLSFGLAGLGFARRKMKA